MSQPRKPYVKPEVTELEKTPELERLFEPAIKEYFRLHPDQYHPKYNPTGREPIRSDKGANHD